MPSPLDKVVVALDYEDPLAARHLVEQLGDRIHRYKIGPQLYTQAGPDIVRFLHEKKKRVFLDLKLYDTPLVVARTVEQFAAMGVEFATVHCLGGRTMLEAAGSACRSSKLRLIGVTLLTSQGSSDSFNWGWPDSEEDMVLRLAGMGMESRLSGVMCSPNELAVLRPRSVPSFLLVTPGIRIPGREVFQEDQRRVASAQQAIEWGADLLIVGRPITQAREPAAVLDTLFS